VPQKPLLLVDVDGVISLFGFAPSAPPPGSFQLIDGIGHLLSDAAGPHLRELAAHYELVWCSGWEEKANDYLPRALGLEAPLPYLSFDHNPGRGNTHWKLAAIDAYAGPDRPLAWVDDALDAECRRWAAVRPGPTRLVATDPAVGLTETQMAELSAWADLLERSVAPGA
jgi:hypothetical protein